MVEQSILQNLNHNIRRGKKALAVLLDPDKIPQGADFESLIFSCIEQQVDFIFAGGSLISSGQLEDLVDRVKAHTSIPVILFPGSNLHICKKADAILFLSLISGRNPDFLIGQHISAAPILRKSELEILPTGYLIIESGTATTVSYMSNTMPIPREKSDIAVCTAMAGEMLGLKMLYLDAGSGAKYPVPGTMIEAVKKSIGIPLIVGGGIKDSVAAFKAYEAGADVLVIGNGIEKNPDTLKQVAEATRIFNEGLNIHQ
ncbi:MAG: geranylgeranylglyceryl/heptaprenylglyceryl phosphate synthase [Cyclobacteriaceae bacterium]